MYGHLKKKKQGFVIICNKIFYLKKKITIINIDIVNILNSKLLYKINSFKTI